MPRKKKDEAAKEVKATKAAKEGKAKAAKAAAEEKAEEKKVSRRGRKKKEVATAPEVVAEVVEAAAPEVVEAVPEVKAEEAPAPKRRPGRPRKNPLPADAEKAAPKAKAKAAKAEKKEAAKEVKAEAPAEEEKKAARRGRRKAVAPTVSVQSLLGGELTIEEIVARVSEKVGKAPHENFEIYIKTEENKAFYVADGENGYVDLW